MNPLFFMNIVPFSVGRHSDAFLLCSSRVVCVHKQKRMLRCVSVCLENGDNLPFVSRRIWVLNSEGTKVPAA